ncbi:DNA-directed RNA polymerase III subunit D [Culex quinquefasciatus]|uniref:DNA-directed RNA polymerase III subunit D n=1 Tax=Culex quinquefasciatus TaxID=7176 RepID=B0WKN9_CULQU|nr:DNA-directed RNA polymerase III subunit D [Culex quinquefasciatus]|eukprot:XP_001849273.1 DNA-directed RNA polymerase III subunit D [Culex quinquefasciatus]
MESTIKIKQEPGLSPKPSATIAGTGPQPLSQPATAIVKTERLTSFRVPRDLTLGGLTNGRAVKPTANKKVYTPNLNAVRNKDTNVKTASTGPKQRIKPERNKDGKAGAGRGKNALIQTSGIFSEGLAQRTLQRSRYEKMNNSAREPGEAMRRPVLRSEIKVDPEEERKRICDLFGEPDEEEGLLSSEGAKKYDSNMPVKLDNLDYKIKLSAAGPLKVEVKDELLKQEPGDLLEAIKANAGAQNNLFLLQLPDALPGKTDTEVRRPDPAAAKPAEGTTENGGAVQDPPRCTVRELEEGYIGKVLRYRSGKVKLLLGETMFDLTMGMDSGFLQELVSINTNAEERSGNIIDLATIKAKLNASPDWEYLFKKAA